MEWILLFVVIVLVPVLLDIKRPSKDTKQKTCDRTHSMYSSNGQFMSKQDKQEYMKSKEWKQLKAFRMMIAKRTCECEGCNNKTNLHLHHITYIRLGHESIADLCILSNIHHQQVHHKVGYGRELEYPLKVLG